MTAFQSPLLRPNEGLRDDVRQKREGREEQIRFRTSRKNGHFETAEGRILAGAHVVVGFVKVVGHVPAKAPEDRND